MQPTPRKKATPINRYSLDKPDCQLSLPADPTSPIRVSSFQGAESTSRTHFSNFPRLFLHPGISMSGKGLNRSRGDRVGSGEPKEPLSLTPREVAERPSWLPRAIHDFLAPT
ncbi:hypothetical protein CRG98_014142 [Punica granatum]|uniref:Uncharacterized protein n=1 Tax=Punica granatum TaxID=22663 RepID=A0A2I0KAC8_PUNGR|nr:hypothetical protein CRG98_014142 [Punica granatum]